MKETNTLKKFTNSSPTTTHQLGRFHLQASCLTPSPLDHVSIQSTQTQTRRRSASTLSWKDFVTEQSTITTASPTTIENKFFVLHCSLIDWSFLSHSRSVVWGMNYWADSIGAPYALHLRLKPRKPNIRAAESYMREKNLVEVEEAVEVCVIGRRWCTY